MRANKHISMVGKPEKGLDLMQGYHSFTDEHGNEYGSFEVFWFAANDKREDGWYWCACCPGCLPDGDANGPFMSSRGAYNDAREQE